MKQLISILEVLLIVASWSLVGCQSPTSGNKTTALTPFVGTWSEPAAGQTGTMTITSSRITVVNTDTNGSNTTVSELVVTNSATSNSLDGILKVDSATTTGTDTNTSVVGNYQHFSLSVSGTTLTVKSASSEETTSALAQADSLANTLTLTKS